MRIHGVLAVVPTALHDDGSLDDAGLAALVDAYGSTGVDGLVVLGVMGEMAELDRDERARVVRQAVRAGGGLPVVVGVGPAGPDQVESARAAATLGAAAVLAGVGGGSGRADQLARVVSAGLPVIAQHHPAATGVRLRHDELVTLVTDVAVDAVKAEAPPTPDLVAAIVGADGPPPLGGLSALYLVEELEAGSHGTITGVAVPELLVEVVGRWFGDDRPGARDAYARLARYLRLEAMPGSAGLVVRKEAWRQRGVLSSSRVRRGRPLGAATKQAITRRLWDCGIDLSDPYPGA